MLTVHPGIDIWAVNVAAPSLQRDLHVSDAAPASVDASR